MAAGVERSASIGPGTVASRRVEVGRACSTENIGTVGTPDPPWVGTIRAIHD